MCKGGFTMIEHFTDSFQTVAEGKMHEYHETKHDETLGKQLIAGFIVSEIFLIAGNLAARVCHRNAAIPEWAILALACVSALPMVMYATKFFRLLREGMDEMMQRIVLDGLAFALVAFVPLAGIYVNLRAAGLMRAQLDPPELLLIPSLLAAIGVWIAWSRHK